MIKYFKYLILFILFACSKGHPTFPTIDKETVIDKKIKEIITYNTRFFKDKLLYKDTLYSIENFDEKGELVKDILHDSDISHADSFKNFYNSDGQLQKWLIFSLRDNSLKNIDTFIYANDLLVKQIELDTLGKIMRTNTYKYDKKKRLIEVSTLVSWGNDHSYIQYEYDNTDNIIKEKGDFHKRIKIYQKGIIQKEFLFYSTNDTVKTATYYYDDENRCIRKSLYYHEQKSEQIETYKYNSNNLVELIEINSQLEKSKSIFRKIYKYK